jgi:hypothetical protein
MKSPIKNSHETKFQKVKKMVAQYTQPMIPAVTPVTYGEQGKERGKRASNTAESSVSADYYELLPEKQSSTMMTPRVRWDPLVQRALVELPFPSGPRRLGRREVGWLVG